MKKSEIFFGIIKIPMDFLMTVLAFLAAYRFRLYTDVNRLFEKAIDYSVLPSPTEYLNFSTYSALALIFIFAINRMYTLKITQTFSKESRKVIFLCGIWAMAIITYYFFIREFPFSRLAILFSWAFTLIAIIFGRAIVRILQRISLKAGIGKRKIILYGNNSISKEIKEKLLKDPIYEIIATVNSFKDLEKLKEKADELIQTQSGISDNQNEIILDFCETKHINYRFIPDLLEVQRTNIEIETTYGIPIIKINPTPLDGWGKVIKRILDIIGSALGLIILSPILLITAITIKIDSKGPILFSKLDNGKPVKRVGQKGKLFHFYKFRSMYPNTHKMRYKNLSAKNTRKDGPLVKIENDPRVTSVGRFIRKYSIDELPQLWNVLIGNMSLVGPRPHLPEEVAQYKKHQRFVLTIKPGLTGLPQISGRSDLNFDEEVKLDRYYIENWSLWKDIKIILTTISVVLKGHKE